MITDDNIITYAYKGLAALFYTIFRKKDKIKGLFYEENVFDDHVKSNNNRLEEASNKALDLDKMDFKYKYKLPNGKIKSNTFAAYNI